MWLFPLPRDWQLELKMKNKESPIKYFTFKRQPKQVRANYSSITETTSPSSVPLYLRTVYSSLSWVSHHQSLFHWPNVVGQHYFKSPNSASVGPKEWQEGKTGILSLRWTSTWVQAPLSPSAHSPYPCLSEERGTRSQFGKWGRQNWSHYL